MRRRKVRTTQAWYELGDQYNQMNYVWLQYLQSVLDEEDEDVDVEGGPRLRGSNAIRLLSGNRYPARASSGRTNDILGLNNFNVEFMVHRENLVRDLHKRIVTGAAPAVSMESPWQGLDLLPESTLKRNEDEDNSN